MSLKICIPALAAFLLAACGGDASSSAPDTTAAPQPTETPAPTPAAAETAAEEWTAEGFFKDEDGNMLSIVWMSEVDKPGWYTACVLGEDWIENGWSGYLTPEDGTLRGALVSNGDEAPLNVTVSEDGGTITFAVEGGQIELDGQTGTIDENGIVANHFTGFELVGEPVHTIMVHERVSGRLGEEHVYIFVDGISLLMV